MRLVLAGLLSLFSLLGLAQGYPERPIRIIVPLTPGGSPDTIARALAQGLQPVWPQAVVVENPPAAIPNISAELAAERAPAGQTWPLAPDSGVSVHTYVGKPPFGPL